MNAKLTPNRLIVILISVCSVASAHAQNTVQRSDETKAPKEQGQEKLGELNQAFLMYPNPFQDVLTVEIPVRADRQIYVDLTERNTGNTIQFNMAYAPVMTINTSQVPPGNYIAKVKGGSGIYYGQMKLFKSRN